MTRAEEAALKAYHTDIPASVRIAFRDGYEQAEKDTIERAARWLEQALSFGVHPCNGRGIVMEFRKEMEEE